MKFLNRFGPWIVAAFIVLMWGSCAALMHSQTIPTPNPFPQALLERAPFTEVPTFAKNLYVKNAAKLPEGDLVTLASTVDPDFMEYLFSAQKENGYRIISVNWSDKACQTTVTVAKGDQVATLHFLDTCAVVYIEPTPAPFHLWFSDPNE